MKAFRYRIVLGVIASAVVGCYVSSESGSQPKSGKTVRGIDWKVVEEKLPRSRREPLTGGLSMPCYPEYPAYTPKPVKDYLIELGAYTDDSKIYDQSGRQIWFLEAFALGGAPPRRDDAMAAWEKYEERRAELEKRYRVIVVENQDNIKD